MSDLLQNRRGFLRGLTTLPLIGGSVALIGNPAKAAVPITRELQERYIAWLANEHAAALFELHPPQPQYDDFQRSMSDWHYARVRTPMYWFPEAQDIEASIARSRPPSTRAALVLSAVGCGWERRHG
jgi:hypothetical protein